MAQIKGFAIRGLLKFIKDSGRAGGISALLAELPEASKAAFASKIGHSAWYPYPAYADLLRLVDLRLGHGDLELMTELGRYAAQNDAGTVFRFVSLFLSVEKLLQRSSMFWARYSDSGVFETLEVEKGHAVGVLRDFPGVAPEHCHLMVGWIEGMALVAGARQADCRKTACVHRGDSHCRYEGTWSL